jgi:GDPmannose 4,6-dehydratase
MKRALILGVTGQDGSYLADLLLEQGYRVYGLVRRSATGNTQNIEHLLNDPRVFGQRFFVLRGDLGDPTSLYRAINEAQPAEIYNEADQDHVRWSYDMVGYSSDITGSAVARLLEIIKQIDPKIRYFQPCTSNMFGLATSEKQVESTPFNPQSPYACCKVFAYYITRYYREAFGMFAANAIFYNHESPRRTVEYVTRKITKSVARIANKKQDKLVLGDLSARIDWGFAGEYMEAAWRILQHDKPDDFVVATGEAHSVKEFVDEAFACVGLDPAQYVSSEAAHFRPTKTSTLIGDTSKLKREVGFEPQIKFKQLVRLMVDADFEAERRSSS